MKVEDSYTEEQFYHEQGTENPGVGGCQSVMFVDGATASAEGDDRDDQPEAEQEDGDGEDGVVVEVKILSPCNLNDYSGNDDNTPEHLKVTNVALFSDQTKKE